MEHWEFSHEGVRYDNYFKIEFAGIVCYADELSVKHLHGAATIIGKLVDGEKPPYSALLVQFPTRQGRGDAYVWPIERTDALELAKRISAPWSEERASVWARSRRLAECYHGEVVARRTLADFYTDVAQSDLDATALD